MYCGNADRHDMLIFMLLISLVFAIYDPFFQWYSKGTGYADAYILAAGSFLCIRLQMHGYMCMMIKPWQEEGMMHTVLISIKKRGCERKVLQQRNPGVLGFMEDGK